MYTGDPLETLNWSYFFIDEPIEILNVKEKTLVKIAFRLSLFKLNKVSEIKVHTAQKNSLKSLRIDDTWRHLASTLFRYWA